LFNKLSLSDVDSDSFSSIGSQEILLEKLREQLLLLINSEQTKIPVISSVVLEIIKVVDDPGSTFDAIAKIAEKDQFLGGKLLKIANSPLYRGAYPISKIADAVRRLGMSEMKKLLFSFSMSTILVKKGVYDLILQDFWKHSLASAICAEEISKMIGIDPAYAYISALMHDIGRTFIVMGAVELEKYVDRQGVFGEAVVRKVSSDIHVKMGEVIAKKWNLPDTIADSIKYHHSVDKARELSEIVLVVHCADKLANFLGYGDESYPSVLENEASFYYLNMSTEQILELKKSLAEKIEVMINEIM